MFPVTFSKFYPRWLCSILWKQLRSWSKVLQEFQGQSCRCVFCLTSFWAKPPAEPQRIFFIFLIFFYSFSFWATDRIVLVKNKHPDVPLNFFYFNTQSWSWRRLQVCFANASCHIWLAGKCHSRATASSPPGEDVSALVVKLSQTWYTSRLAAKQQGLWETHDGNKQASLRLGGLSASPELDD